MVKKYKCLDGQERTEKCYLKWINNLRMEKLDHPRDLTQNELDEIDRYENYLKTN